MHASEQHAGHGLPAGLAGEPGFDDRGHVGGRPCEVERPSVHEHEHRGGAGGHDRFEQLLLYAREGERFGVGALAHRSPTEVAGLVADDHDRKRATGGERDRGVDATDVVADNVAAPRVTDVDTRTRDGTYRVEHGRHLDAERPVGEADPGVVGEAVVTHQRSRVIGVRSDDRDGAHRRGVEREQRALIAEKRD